MLLRTATGMPSPANHPQLSHAINITRLPLPIPATGDNLITTNYNNYIHQLPAPAVTTNRGAPRRSKRIDLLVLYNIEVE